MKTFVLTIACIFFLDQVSAEWEPEDEICSKKLNITKSVIENYNNKRVNEIDNEVYNKYSECYWLEKKMLNEDGTINWEGVKKQLAALGDFKKCSAVIDKCRKQNIVGKDVGQTVVKNQNCITKGYFGDS